MLLGSEIRFEYKNEFVSQEENPSIQGSEFMTQTQILTKYVQNLNLYLHLP